MNFLAHIYLSGNNEKLMIGNFIGDFVKGNQLNDFELVIKQGIHLHRAIDEYTDQHPIVSQSKDRLRAKYRHYSGVITDVFYDHFLAKNWDVYHPKPLIEFTLDTYKKIQGYNEVLPKGARYMLPYMIENNWLYNYSKVEGINKALSGMANRTKFHSKMEQAVEDLKINYEAFDKEFNLFFVELKAFVSNWIAVEKDKIS